MIINATVVRSVIPEILRFSIRLDAGSDWVYYLSRLKSILLPESLVYINVHRRLASRMLARQSKLFVWWMVSRLVAAEAESLFRLTR